MAVKVVPNASRSEIVGRYGDRLRIRVAATPERGKANEALCLLLRSATDAETSSVVKGASNANKVILLTGVTAATVRERLGG